jgi:hypothetical protein
MEKRKSIGDDWAKRQSKLEIGFVYFIYMKKGIALASHKALKTA